MAKKPSSARSSTRRTSSSGRARGGGRTSRITAVASAIVGLVVVGGFALTQFDVIDVGDLGAGADGATEITEAADFQETPDSANVDQARQWLDELTIAEEDDPPGYDRSLFPHWDSNVEDNCTTRQVVLLRDGENVETDENCQPVSGSWYSAYDGETLTDAGDVDIDHMVALKEAWRSGAHAWSTDERQRFANDLDSSQLWAVSASSNRAKGDQDPADWLPPREANHCAYVVSWVEVKHTWDLTADPEEETALREVLDGC